MKKIIFLGYITLMLVFSCSEKPTEITLEDSNQDTVYRIGSESGVLGNIDMHLIPNTIQGSAIVLLNGPGSHIGYDIRKKNDSAFIYFADSYIKAGGYSLQAGTKLPVDQWLKIRLVVYESGLSGWIVALLQSLGMDFFDQIEDYMIEKVYEADIYLASEDRGLKKIQWHNVTEKYKSK